MELFFIFFFIMFFAVFGLVISTFILAIIRWNKNNNSPRITVSAKVVTKRQRAHTHHNTETHIMNTTYTHLATFEFESGDRLELIVPSIEYGLLAEGDEGKLTFQGTRFLSFERER